MRPEVTAQQRQTRSGWIDSLTQFLTVEAAGGVVLLVCATVALVLANSLFRAPYEAIWQTMVGWSAGSVTMQHSLRHWINDGLMAVFFLVVGLEIKRELAVGELRDRRAALLPAALGGMVLPAAIYLGLQWGQDGAAGWGIPMATDIAFVVGCLAVLGPRVPHGLRVFLLSLAIIDDIGAILVVAFGYSTGIDARFVALGLAGLVAVAILVRIGVTTIVPFVVAGALTWLAFHESGVHATIAGVLLGLLAPARAAPGEHHASHALDRLGERLGGSHDDVDEAEDVTAPAATAAHGVESPLERLESALHPFVSFVVMPIFALANAGVALELEGIGHPVALAVIAGLVVGKPVGVSLFAWLAVRLRWTRLPTGVSWPLLVGAGCLAGIGFTMALFISSLALDGTLLDAAKIGVLAGSLVAGVAGFLLIWLRLPETQP
ncbi:MAG: Na+/H+ antiporter NhaA [Luteitalea sp.]|nr:Na+/H+ antiporter NhaA [Luteitalea sp.]